MDEHVWELQETLSTVKITAIHERIACNNEGMPVSCEPQLVVNVSNMELDMPSRRQLSGHRRIGRGALQGTTTDGESVLSLWLCGSLPLWLSFPLLLSVALSLCGSLSLQLHKLS